MIIWYLNDNMEKSPQYLSGAADLDKSKCYHIQNSLGYCLFPSSLEEEPMPRWTSIHADIGCNQDWQLFCPTPEGYIKHFTSGLCVQSDPQRRNDIILTDLCWPEFKELPNKGGIVDNYEGCMLPYYPGQAPEKPIKFSPVRLLYTSDCEVEDAKLFFKRG